MLKEVKKGKENVAKTDEYTKMKETLKLVYSETEAHEMALKMVQERYDKQYDALEKQKNKEAKLLKKTLRVKERMETIANKSKLKRDVKNAREDWMQVEDTLRQLEAKKEELKSSGQKLGATKAGAEYARLSKEQKKLEAKKSEKEDLERRLKDIGIMGFLRRQKENYEAFKGWLGGIDWKGGMGKVFGFSKKLLIYTLPLIMGIFLIFEVIKSIAKTGDLMGTVMTAIKEIMGGVFTALEGVMMIFQAFFGGGTFGERLGTLLTGFGKIFGGLGTILWAVLKGVLKLAVGLFVGVVALYWKLFFKVIHGIFNFPTIFKNIRDKIEEWYNNKFPEGIIKSITDGFLNMMDKMGTWLWDLLSRAADAILPFASGGTVTNSGLQLVGERGPELVKLPMGSRVHSNKDSRSMLASSNNTTINVSVNGRVGASDTELRDIAKKVGRMVSAEINRTTSSSTNVRY